MRTVVKETVMTCPECGWPGVGNMPAGVRQLNRDGKATLIGQLTYFSAADEGPLCSVCRDMKWAVAERSWFVEAHREYMDQLKVKRKLLGEPDDKR